MTKDPRKDEIERRELAQANKGRVVSRSGTPVEPRRLDQMISVRLDPDVVIGLRRLAESTGTSISELLRTAAAQLVANAQMRHVSVELTRVVTSGIAGLEEIDPRHDVMFTYSPLKDVSDRQDLGITVGTLLTTG
jgi:predicted transcriptional regulator